MLHVSKISHDTKAVFSIVTADTAKRQSTRVLCFFADKKGQARVLKNASSPHISLMSGRIHMHHAVLDLRKMLFDVIMHRFGNRMTFLQGDGGIQFDLHIKIHP